MRWPFVRARRAAEPDVWQEAYDLRLRYGVNAEQWCEIGLLAARTPDQKRRLESIHAALAQTPW